MHDASNIRKEPTNEKKLISIHIKVLIVPVKGIVENPVKKKREYLKLN